MTRHIDDLDDDDLERRFINESLPDSGIHKSKFVVVTLYRRQGNVYPPPRRSWLVRWFSSTLFLLSLCLLESGIGLLLALFNLLDWLPLQSLMIVWVIVVGLFITAFGLMLGSGQIKKMDAAIWVPSLILWFLSVGVTGPLATWGRDPWVTSSTYAQFVFIFASLGTLMLTMNAGFLFTIEAIRVIKA